MVCSGLAGMHLWLDSKIQLDTSKHLRSVDSTSLQDREWAYCQARYPHLGHSCCPGLEK